MSWVREGKGRAQWRHVVRGSEDGIDEVGEGRGMKTGACGFGGMPPAGGRRAGGELVMMGAR